MTIKEKELNNYIDTISSKGIQKTTDWMDLWSTSLNYFFGNQNYHRKKLTNWTWVSVNYLWPSAQQEIAKLARNNPQIYCTPFEDSDAEAAEAWQGNLQWQWNKGLNKSGMRIPQLRGMLDCKLFGYRVSKIFWEDKCYWNDQTQQWEGDVKYKLWHPAEFWADSDEDINDGNCGTWRWVALEWAKARWPEHAKAIEDESVESDNTTGTGPDIAGSKSTNSATAKAAGVFAGGTDSGEEDTEGNMLVGFVNERLNGVKPAQGEKLVKIEEIYFKDQEEEDVTIEEDVPPQELMASGAAQMVNGFPMDTVSGQPMTSANWPKRVAKKYKKPLYPNGRFVVRCGKTILNPKVEDQVYPYTVWPFITIPHYMLPHMWQGSNAVELYRDMQDLINTSVSYLFNNVKMHGAPKLAIESDAIAVDPKTKKSFSIGAGAGAIIRLVRGGLTRMKIIPPPPMSPAVAMLYQLFSQEFKNMTGLQSMSRGEQSKGDMSATEASYVAISSQDRIFLQSIMEDCWVTGVMSMVAEVVQKNYDPGRWMRIVGDQNQMGVQQITSQMKNMRFDVTIAPSSQLPFDESKRLSELMQAYGILKDPTPNPLLPELLRSLKIHSWQKILSELPAYRQFIGIKQLYDAVSSGQMQPQQAVQIITNEAISQFQNSMQGKIAATQPQSQIDNGEPPVQLPPAGQR